MNKVSSSKLELLEALRGFAALYVVVHHFNLEKYSIFGHLLGQGQAAVMLFFVLSGFVMYYANYRSKENNTLLFKTYFIKRFRRIYPVFIIALAISYLAACWESKEMLTLNIPNLLGNLLNLQDMNRLPGMWFTPYYGNTPLWSLSYEWWFYLLFFPIFKFFDDKQQRIIVLSISIIGFLTYYLYPNKISITLEYFIIWWLGVELARSWITHGKITANTIKYVGVSLGIMILLTIGQVAIYKLNGNKLVPKDHPVIEFVHFFQTLFIIGFGLTWQRFSFIGYKYLLKPFILFAPISYGIYVFHPALMYKRNIYGFDNIYLVYFVGFMITLLVSYLTEVRLQNWINKKTDRYLRK